MRSLYTCISCRFDGFDDDDDGDDYHDDGDGDDDDDDDDDGGGPVRLGDLLIAYRIV